MGQVVDIGRARVLKQRRDTRAGMNESGLRSKILIDVLIAVWENSQFSNDVAIIPMVNYPDRQLVRLQTSYPDSLASRIEAEQPWYLNINILYRTRAEIERTASMTVSFPANGRSLEYLGFTEYLTGLFGENATGSPYFVNTAQMFATMLESGNFVLISSGIDRNDRFTLSLLGPDAEYHIDLDARGLQGYHELIMALKRSALADQPT